MTSNQPYYVSGGKLALALILATVLGVLCPIVTVVEVMMTIPVLMLSGILMVFLYCFAGRGPALLFMVMQLISTSFFSDATFMWMSLVAGTLPAIFVMRGIAAKKPFFEQMKVSLIAYGAGLILAVFIAYMTFGGNMIGRLTDTLKAQLSAMPDEVFQPFLETLNAALSAAGLSDVELLTMEAYRAQIAGVMTMFGEIYSRAVPGALLSGAVISGVLSVLWGNWLMARHGLATNESYIGPLRWFLPGQVTLGLSLIWGVSYILTQTDYASGEVVYISVYNLVTTAFTIQALAAIDRVMFRRGASEARRRRWITIALIFGLVFRFAGLALFFTGAASALFGSHGALRGIIRPRDNDHSDHDDHEQ